MFPIVGRIGFSSKGRSSHGLKNFVWKTSEPVSFAPPGLGFIVGLDTHSLRCGLHSFAALRLCGMVAWAQRWVAIESAGLAVARYNLAGSVVRELAICAAALRPPQALKRAHSLAFKRHE